MFEFIFGLIWTLFTCAMIYFFYFAGVGEISVNGVPVSQEEFNAMLMPKIFFGIFLLVGISFLIAAIRKLIINANTSMNGHELYGYILENRPNGVYVNGYPLFNAVVLFRDVDGKFQVLEDNIGKKTMQYYPGAYVQLKHRNKDINIIGLVDEHIVPLDVRNMIAAEKSHPKYSNFQASSSIQEECSDTVIIDGVEYVKKDVLDAGKKSRNKSPFDE